MLMLVGMGNPLGTRNPHGYGFGKNFISVMGMGFLTGVFFLRGYGFGQVIPAGFYPLPSLPGRPLPHACGRALPGGRWFVCPLLRVSAQTPTPRAGTWITVTSTWSR
jgi:hypothetical protein